MSIGPELADMLVRAGIATQEQADTLRRELQAARDQEDADLLKTVQREP